MSGSWLLDRSTTFVHLTVAAIVAVAATACTAAPGASFDPGGASPILTLAPVETPGAVASTSAHATANPPATQEPAMTPASTLAGIDSPPDALLAAEGGDPVMGQLGTNSWKNGGSDAPWLRGAPISVGAGEPLALTFLPGFDVASWRTWYVPADSDGQSGGPSLGEGVGQPAFRAPEAGTWTVVVTVTFREENGQADYYWRLDVR
ncbi:MAG: hypothetical protein ABIP77_06345 [Candidatus Limnocylindrales bacterium]